MASKKPNPTTSHDQNRAKCCLFCWRWTRFNLTDNLKIDIQTLFSIQIDFSDRRVPLGICGSCKVGVSLFKKNKINSKKIDLLHRNFDFIRIPPATRSDYVCSCEICKVAKGPVYTAGNFKKNSGAAKKLDTIPELAPQKPTGTVPKQTAKIPCPECYTNLTRVGAPHPCNKEIMAQNMQKKMEENPSVGEKVITRILRNKDPSPGGRVSLFTGGGRSTMKVVVNAPKGIFQKKQFSAHGLHELCLDLRLGIGAEKAIGAKLNKVFGMGTMEAGYQQQLIEMSRLVSEKTHVTEMEFKMSDTDENLVTLPLWSVNDLNDYLRDIHGNRDIDYSATTILLGTDMGQKFLKFTLQVIDNNELEQRSEGKNVKYKSTGVNKIHFFALCDSRVPESNYNCAKVFNHVKAHLVKYNFTGDLKMLMKFYGKQPCSCKHSCYICEAPNNDFLNPNHPLSTFESAIKNYNDWRASGGKRKDLKNFNNQEFLPVGVEHMTPEELKEPILLKSPCPPLHLLLSTNTFCPAGMCGPY